jgi:hypothetical protein
MQESCEQKQRRAGFVGSAKEVAQNGRSHGSPRSGPLERFLSNTIAIVLLFALREPNVVPGSSQHILISFYIIHSWYMTGKDQIEQLTGKSAPEDFIEELMEIASSLTIMEVDVPCLWSEIFWSSWRLSCPRDSVV